MLNDRKPVTFIIIQFTRNNDILASFFQQGQGEALDGVERRVSPVLEGALREREAAMAARAALLDSLERVKASSALEVRYAKR